MNIKSCHLNTQIPNTKTRPNLSNHPFQLLLCWQMSKPHHHRPKLLLLLMTAKEMMLTSKKLFVKKSFCNVDTLVVIVPSPSISNSKKASLISSTFINDLELLQPQKIVTNAACKHRNSFTCASDSSTPAITLSLKAIETQSCLHQYWCA